MVVRMVALVLVVAAGVSYIAFDVLGNRAGAGPYTLSVDLARAGGLYPDASVTYRGVDVGRVSALDLTTRGVTAVLAVDPGVEIPVQVQVNVRDLSAAGEQYLDLVPTGPATPVLRAGAVIPESETAVPVTVGTLLTDVGALVGGLDPADVQTVTEALGTGLGGTGEDLRTIASASAQLIAALEAAQPATSQLIQNSGPLLSTANATGGDFASFSQGLAQLTGQLRSSDADIRTLLANGTTAESAFSTLLTQDSATLNGFLGNLSTDLGVAAQRQAAVQVLLSVLPVFAGEVSSVVGPDGQVRVELKFNDASTVCPYITGAQTPELTVTTGAPTLDRTCTLTAPDLLQRGSADAPVAPGG